MFVRIVKMSLHSKFIADFQTMFDEKKSKIRATAGCQLLELYQDKNNPEIFFTYSYWNNESDLENLIEPEQWRTYTSKRRFCQKIKCSIWL